jgi:hypothetical protein
MTIENPFSAAIKYLASDLDVLLRLGCGEDDLDVMSCRAGLRVLEAAGKVDKKLTEKVLSAMWQAYQEHRYFILGEGEAYANLFIILSALPDKEK